MSTLEVRCLPRELATHGLGHVNCYLVSDGRAAILIDTGWGDAPSVEDFARLVEKESEVPLNAIFVTHNHPDHFGAAIYLAENLGAPALMSQADIDGAILRYEEWETYVRQVEEWCDSLGFDQALRNAAVFQVEMFVVRLGGASVTNAVRDGKLIPLESFVLPFGDIVVSGGHTNGHRSFYLSEIELRFDGDMMLPRTNINVSLRPGLHSDAVERHMRYLTELIRSSVSEVHPGHGSPITEPQARAAALFARHIGKLDRLSAVLDQKGLDLESAEERMVSVAAALFGLERWRGLSDPQRLMVVGEAAAYLAHMKNRTDQEEYVYAGD